MLISGTGEDSSWHLREDAYVTLNKAISSAIRDWLKQDLF